MNPMALYSEALGLVDIAPVPIPHDGIDGFLCAWWRRPQAYLDPKVRAAMSSFSMVGDVTPALARLADDLGSGVWDARFGELRNRDTIDLGYRLAATR